MLLGLAAPGDRWSRTDSLLAQAWSDVERLKCPDCGTPLWLAYDPELEMKWAAELPTRCHPCTAIASRAEGYGESPHPHALRFGVALKP